MNSLEWEQRRVAVVNRMKEMNGLARTEERELTPAEQSLWNTLEADEIRLRGCRDEARRVGR